MSPATEQDIPFSNDDRRCRERGVWAVRIIQSAAAAGCDVRQAKEVLDPKFH